mgnify:CR=1 FL=1
MRHSERAKAPTRRSGGIEATEAGEAVLPPAGDKAAQLLALRPHFRRELETKLQRAGYAREEIAEVRSSLDTITFRFRSGQTFEVTARRWKGAPFVAFKPHERPR